MLGVLFLVVVNSQLSTVAFFQQIYLVTPLHKKKTQNIKACFNASWSQVLKNEEGASHKPWPPQKTMPPKDFGVPSSKKWQNGRFLCKLVLKKQPQRFCIYRQIFFHLVAVQLFASGGWASSGQTHTSDEKICWSTVFVHLAIVYPFTPKKENLTTETLQQSEI